MKNWITNVLVNKIFMSRKFIYGLTGLVVPYLITKFGWDTSTAEQVWQTCLVLILGQGIADINKK